MPVETVPVACNNCGASLDVREDTRFATCAHCGSRLAVHRTAAAAYTEVLDEIRQTTRSIADDVDALRRHAEAAARRDEAAARRDEVAAIDREWEARRRSLMWRYGDGRTAVPTRAGSVVVGTVTAGAGVLWTVLSAGVTKGSSALALFGLLFAGVGVVMAVGGCVKADRYDREEAAYRRRRAAAMGRAGDVTRQ